VDVKLLNIDELCEQYNFRKWTIRSYCSQGLIPYIKIGRRVYFRPEDINHWIDQHAKTAQEIKVEV
jgi:excisionase family DNA binding protein